MRIEDHYGAPAYCALCDHPCSVGPLCNACMADDDDDDEVCRTCGERYPGFGDGWDGECPSCADRTHIKEEEDELQQTGRGA